WMATITVDGKPLVGQSETLYASRRHDAPENPAPQWGAYGLFSLLLSLLVAVALRFEPGFWSLLPWRIAVLSTGLSGVLVLLMWFGTSHEAVDGNRVVLLLNPAWLLMLLPLPRPPRIALWWLLAAAALAGAVLLASPGSPQYRPQVVAGLLPLLAAVVWGARRCLPTAAKPGCVAAAAPAPG